MKNLVFVAAITFTLVGCVTTQGLNVAMRTHIYGAPFAQVFRASIDYCDERGLAITSADKDLGIINTDYRENDGAQRFLFGRARARLNLSLKAISPDKTRIIANISAEVPGAFGSWTQATGSEAEVAKMYDQVFTGIGSRLEIPDTLKGPTEIHLFLYDGSVVSGYLTRETETEYFVSANIDLSYPKVVKKERVRSSTGITP